jgi:hypothetical protein
MTTSPFKINRPADNHLARVIEPLASYICASERPRETMLSVLAVLKGEVAAMNQAALGHFAGPRGQSLELVA